MHFLAKTMFGRIDVELVGEVPEYLKLKYPNLNINPSSEDSAAYFIDD